MPETPKRTPAEEIEPVLLFVIILIAGALLLGVKGYRIPAESTQIHGEQTIPAYSTP
jgi:hypothetical protein